MHIGACVGLADEIENRVKPVWSFIQ